MVQELNTMVKQKHRLERKYGKYQVTYGAEYRCLRKRVKKVMVKAKELYYTNKIETCGNKPKASWDVLAEGLDNSKSDSKIGDLLINGNTCNDDGIKTNHTNEFFTNIGHSVGQHFIDADSYLSYLTNNVKSAFSFELITLHYLGLLVKKNSKKLS